MTNVKTLRQALPESDKDLRPDKRVHRPDVETLERRTHA